MIAQLLHTTTVKLHQPLFFWLAKRQPETISTLSFHTLLRMPRAPGIRPAQTFPKSGRWGRFGYNSFGKNSSSFWYSILKTGKKLHVDLVPDRFPLIIVAFLDFLHCHD